MPYLFDNLQTIVELTKREPFALLTDVDGTISNTTLTPEQATVTPLCREYLSILCSKLPLVAAISGRSVLDVKKMVGIEQMAYIGNHGMERWKQGRSELVQGLEGFPELIKSLTEYLSCHISINGVKVENKGITATIHYRQTTSPETSQYKIMQTLEQLPQTEKLRIMQGKMSINLLPPMKINKGTAVLDLIGKHKSRGGIYLGDEITDLDAFEAIHSASRGSDFRGLSIGVVSQEMPGNFLAAVDFTLKGINDVERFLQWLTQNIP